MYLFDTKILHILECKVVMFSAVIPFDAPQMFTIMVIIVIFHDAVRTRQNGQVSHTWSKTEARS